jgi:hypothetical protein
MKTENAYEYLIHNHLIRHTVDDILRLTWNLVLEF